MRSVEIVLTASFDATRGRLRRRSSLMTEGGLSERWELSRITTQKPGETVRKSQVEEGRKQII
jgi:hypothetical protein